MNNIICAKCYDKAKKCAKRPKLSIPINKIYSKKLFFQHRNFFSKAIYQIIEFVIGKPVSWIMIAPSVTPRKTNVGSNNPAMRLYKFDTDTGQVSSKILFCLIDLIEENIFYLSYYDSNSVEQFSLKCTGVLHAYIPYKSYLTILDVL